MTDPAPHPAHGWWKCAGCGTENAPDVDSCLCGARLRDQPDPARPLMTQKQAENLDELARAGLRGWPKGDGMCPECGEKPAKMTSNLVNGDVVYTCPIGHEWVSDETQRSRPVETAAADKGTQSRKRAKD